MSTFPRNVSLLTITSKYLYVDNLRVFIFYLHFLGTDDTLNGKL